MGFLENNHCGECKSKTKLLVKNGKKLNFWCSVADKCPYSKPMDETQTKSESGRKL